MHIHSTTRGIYLLHIEKIKPRIGYTNMFRHIGFAELGPKSRASVQLKLNFCLPAASQLLHPKEMCLNAALNQIAFVTL